MSRKPNHWKIIVCLDGMNRHAARARAVAALLEQCDGADLPKGVLTDAAGLIFDELCAVQGWVRQLEESCR